MVVQQTSLVWLLVLPIAAFMSIVVNEQYIATQEQVFKIRNRPELIMKVIQLTCEEMQRSTANVTCDSDAVSARASDWIRWVQVAQGGGSIAVVGLAGSVSDRFGRRPVLVCALVGYVVLTAPSLLIECVPALREQWRPLLLVGWVLGGLTGGVSGILLATFAFVADVVPAARRPTIFTVVEAIIGLGGVFGVLAGGYCMDMLGSKAVFIAILGAELAMLLYTLVVLPESLPRDRRTATWDTRMFVCFYSLAVLLDPVLLRPRRHLLPLVVAFLFAFFTVQGVDNVTTSYLSAAPLSWSDSLIGIFNCAGLGSRVVAGLVLAPLAEHWLRSEAAELGLVCTALLVYGVFVGLLGLLQALAPLMAFTSVAGMASSLCFGYLRGLLSRSAGPRDQGRMLGATTFVVSASQSLSPLLFNSIYSATANNMPGLAFYMLGLSSLIALLIIVCFVRPMALPPGTVGDDEQKPLLPNPINAPGPDGE